MIEERNDTLEDEVEPFLLRSEMVVRTPRGRVATERTYRHLRLDLPDPDPSDADASQGELFS